MTYISLWHINISMYNERTSVYSFTFYSKNCCSSDVYLLHHTRCQLIKINPTEMSSMDLHIPFLFRVLCFSVNTDDTPSQPIVFPEPCFVRINRGFNVVFKHILTFYQSYHFGWLMSWRKSVHTSLSRFCTGNHLAIGKDLPTFLLYVWPKILKWQPNSWKTSTHFSAVSPCCIKQKWKSAFKHYRLP